MYPYARGRLLEARLVAGLPDLGERDGAVEPVEDAERYADPLHEGPGQEAVEVDLHGIGRDLLRLERVDDPHGDVADEEEGDDLPAGLAAVVLRQMDPPARDVGDEEHLQDDLEDREQTGDHHQEIRLVGEGGERAGDHAEDGVGEQTEGGDAQEDVVEVALLLGLELEALHAYEADDDGDDREGHERAMGHVGEVDGEEAEVGVMDEHEEEDQADERADEEEQSEEQTLAGSHAVHTAVT